MNVKNKRVSVADSYQNAHHFAFDQASELRELVSKRYQNLIFAHALLRVLPVWLLLLAITAYVFPAAPLWVGILFMIPLPWAVGIVEEKLRDDGKLIDKAFEKSFKKDILPSGAWVVTHENFIHSGLQSYLTRTYGEKVTEIFYSLGPTFDGSAQELLQVAKEV